VVSEGGLLDVEVQLDGSGPLGAKFATLTLTTDQGAAFGGSGAQFTWDLTGNVVQASSDIPEPAAITLLALGGLALAARRRRSAAR
jgi:hypothetical protein